VGGGFTGLWAALLAAERDPGRDVVVLEGDRIAEGASGRNGGFFDSSLTHGLHNGLRHYPGDMQRIEKVGRENYEGLAADVDRLGIDCCLEMNGVLSVATEPHQVEWLDEYAEDLEKHGEKPLLLDRAATRAEVDSPTYLGSVLRQGLGLVEPAALAWGLRDAALRAGVRVYENTPVEGMTARRVALELRCPGAVVRARRAVLATNAFRSPLARMRRSVIPVWDYALVTEPLSEENRAKIGWRRRQGIGDMGNQFHYYRLTRDDRILWGGYDAIYHYGSRTDAACQQRRESFEGLSRRFFETFPQLEGLRFTHSWGGAIATTTRFCMDVGTAHGGRTSWSIGYTGLGVGASRFGARVALDLIDDPASETLSLEMVKRRSFPWPPEPIRYLGVQLTRRALARADRRQGRRGPWLRLLDALKLGYDS
jgi:glycine/D-amino acid oxidase-like deaminating enzyme